MDFIEINSLDTLKAKVSEENVCLIKVGTLCCGMCNLVEDNIKKVMFEYPEVTFIKVDGDECGDDVLDFLDVSSIPEVVIFKEGNIAVNIKGVKTPDYIRDELNAVV